MTNLERIQENNANLRECIEIANALPEAGGGGGEPTPTQEKSIEIKENGTVEVTPDEGYALSKVTANVNVPIPDGYIKPSGTLNIDKNGSYDVTEKAEVVVAVPDRAVVLQDKTVTENGTYTADSGYDGLGTVTVQVASSGGGEDHLDDLLNGSITEINSSVSKLVAYACYGVTTLKTVNLPNATTSGGYAFRGCSGLTSFNAPNLATIGNYMFYGCSKLTSVNFPKATTVPSTSFYQCTTLKKADFAVAKSISSSAFAYCTQLETLILRRSDAIVTVATNSFDGVTTFKGYVYVPKALISDYENYTNWATKFTGKFRAIEDYPDICG